MTARSQILQHRVIVSPLDHHFPWAGNPWPETRGPVLGVERWRVDRLLDVEVMVHHAQEHDQRPLILLLPTRRAERHPGLTIAKRETRRQRGAWTLARLQRIR